MAFTSGNDKVWGRTRGMDEVSANVFNMIFAGTTAFGLAMYGILAHSYATTVFTFWPSMLILAIAFGGCFVAAMDFAPAKLLGMTMISGGLGALSGGFYHQYTKGSIENIAMVVVVLVAVLGAVGTLIPRSLESWGGALFTLLFALIIAQVVCSIFLPYAARTFLDWCGVLLFGAILIFDFNRAQRVSKTTENAMDCGISVFLDIANIMMYLMELFGVKSSDD